jgi:hypothetical protein
MQVLKGERAMNEKSNKEFEFNVRIAQQMFKEHGKVISMVIGQADDKRYVLPFFSTSREERHAKANMIKRKFRSLGVTAITFMTEAWFNAYDKESEWDGVMPGDKPEDQRREGLIIVYVSKTEHRDVMFEIKRDGKGARLEKMSESVNDINTQDNLWGDMFC